MLTLELFKTFIEYHIDLSRRVWDAIDQITEEQFLTDDAYSRGSIRNLMVHLTSTDRRWLTGLKNQPDVGHLNAEEYPTRAAAREIFQRVATEMTDYIATLTEENLSEPTNEVAEPAWQILLHLINHGTDHRATVLQKLHEFGVPTFDQDFIMWIWGRK